MQKIQEINSELTVSESTVTSDQVRHFFNKKGYKVCNVIQLNYTNMWLAILIKNKEFWQATVFTTGKNIERFEESVM